MSQSFTTSDEAIQTLEKADLQDPASVVIWVNQYLTSLVMQSAIRVTGEQQARIAQLLESHGYQQDAYLGDEFVDDDPIIHAKYVIGQFMNWCKYQGMHSNLGAQSIWGKSEKWMQQFASTTV